MCGINVIGNFDRVTKNGKTIIEKMNSVLAHRGPDGAGVFESSDSHVFLGSRRLSIVDVPHGNQPVVVDVKGDTYAIVFNGEIFNYKDIKAKLKKTYPFKTESDTEVLLFAYIEWGIGCLEHLNGQFAFAIYDDKGEKIFFAKDRVGIKPLYYSTLPDKTLLISSEPKGILSYPDFPRALDNEAIADYFLGTMTLVNGCEPLDRSFFKDIHALNPGMYGVLSKEGLKIGAYYDVPVPKLRNIGRYESQLRKALEDAILEQIPSEVTYGTALSGGIDSSIVTAVAARHSEQKLLSCAIRFEDTQENPDYEHAKILAAQENIRLLSPILTGERLMRSLDDMVLAMDKPHDTVRQLGLFELYKTLHQEGCKVVLVGEGSDEFNLGYYDKSPGFKRDIDAIHSTDAFRNALQDRASEAARFFSASFNSSVSFGSIIERNIEEYYEACPSEDALDRMEYYYIKKFLKYRLDANDRCAMAHSVEARVPFCDNNVIELSLKIPHSQNLVDGTEKAVLRNAFADLLPEEITHRRKYALPESKDLGLYKIIVDELNKNIQQTDSRVWKTLNKDYIMQLAHTARRKIDELEETEKGIGELTSEIPLTSKVEFRIKHAFLALTFLRWFQLYFVERVFA